MTGESFLGGVKIYDDTGVDFLPPKQQVSTILLKKNSCIFFYILFLYLHDNKQIKQGRYLGS